MFLLTLKSDKKDGFTTLLRANTGGKGFAVMKFSHWQKVDGDVLYNQSIASKFVMDIRKRKGIFYIYILCVLPICLIVCLYM